MGHPPEQRGVRHSVGLLRGGGTLHHPCMEAVPLAGMIAASRGGAFDRGLMGAATRFGADISKAARFSVGKRLATLAEQIRTADLVAGLRPPRSSRGSVHRA